MFVKAAFLFLIIGNLAEALSTNTSCPDGFEALGKSCYLAKCPELEWKEAHEFCEAHNSNLVVINSENEADYLSEWLNEQDIHNSFWAGIIGLGDYLKQKHRKRSAHEILPFQCVLNRRDGFRCFNPGKAVTICETEPTENFNLSRPECPSGWVQLVEGKCHLFGTYAILYDDAVPKCQNVSHKATTTSQ